MDGIEIRLAVPDDDAAVADYHDRCFAHTYAAQVRAGELTAPDLAGTRAQLRAWFEPGSGFETRVAVAVAADSAGDAVPIAHVTVFESHLVHLFVEPARHGTGLGRRMLELGESLIATAGHIDLELHTRVDNHNAIAFYQAFGWTMTDRVITTVEHGISYDEHVLVKHRRNCLVPLTRANWRAALEVRVTDEQLPMVADFDPVALVVLAKAYVQPGVGRWEPLGFVDEAGEMVAVFALSHVDGVSEVRNFAVDHRRQRTGVGTQAIAAVLDWCRSLGSSAVELTVNPRNVGGVAFYERVGFRPTGETRNGQPVLRINVGPIETEE